MRGPRPRGPRPRGGRQRGDRAARRVRGSQPTIIPGRNPAPEQKALRLHLDVNPTDRDQAAELERLLALGACPAEVGQTGEEPWHVLADPEGNVFCLLEARLDPL